MTDSATLKINRATELTNELKDIFLKKRPFQYILETNTLQNQRATFARSNESVVNKAALICGDVVHNLRAALDHGYWEIVSPFASSDREKKTLQFPFSDTAARLEEAVKNRLAEKVSISFFQALLELKPYAEPGGNESLFLIHKLDILDKHKLLIPTGNFTTFTSELLIKQVPDLPRGIINFGCGQNQRDVVWNIPPMNRAQRRAAKIPDSGVREQILNVPVEIVFTFGDEISLRPVIPTLHQLIAVATSTLRIMRSCT